MQATAGESVLIPMVARGEIDLGMANMLEVVEGIETGKLQNDLRIIGSIYVLRMGFFARKDSGIVNMADLKGKRVPAGYSAMRTLDKNTQAMLATADLTLNDVKPVMVPNVLRGGDDFMAGAERHVHVLVRRPEGARGRRHGRRRARAQDRQQPRASRKIFPYGYFTEVKPIPAYVGVSEPMKVYAMDYILFTNSKMKDEIVAKIIDTMANNKADMVATAPAHERLLGRHDVSQAQHDLSSRRAEILPGQEDRSQGLLATKANE